MISMKGYSAIMRCIGRIEGIASCEEDEIQASLIMNADRICKILEAEMASESESPTRFAGAPFRQGAIPLPRSRRRRSAGWICSARCRPGLLRAISGSSSAPATAASRTTGTTG